MKYIRTKDNIYEIVNDYGSSCAVKSRGKRGKIAIDGFTIKYGLSYAPRADTIKKLCDMFVLYDEQFADDASFNHIVFASLEEAKKNMKYHTDKTIIYGAIWTDKGLIYVAKMNEKGELELL